MVLSAVFELLTSSIMANNEFDLQVAGQITFVYDGNNKFTKGYINDIMCEGVAKLASDNIINSFTIGKRQYPNLGRYKIIEAIAPLKLDAIPMIIIKECSSLGNHIYGYRTNIINEFDNGNPRVLDIEGEFLQAYERLVFNPYKDGVPVSTDITGLEETTLFKSESIKLPVVPFEMWDICNRDSFLNQIDKLEMLC